MCTRMEGLMKNITLSIDDDLLRLGREYARLHKISFNSLVRQLIEQTVASSSDEWLNDTFDLIDRNPVSSSGIAWRREELHRV